MPKFEITVDGLKIPVHGANSLKDAQVAVRDAIAANPKFVEEQRQKFLDTGDHTITRFRIGAGHEIHDAGMFLGRAAAATMGQFSRADAIHQEQKMNRESFARLDDKGIGAEDVGQFAPDIAAGVVGVGSLGLRAGIAARNMAKNIAMGKLGMTKKQAETFMTNLFNTKMKDVPIDKFVETLTTKGGDALPKALGKIDKVEDAAKLVDAVVDSTKAATEAISKQALARVRDAQVKVAQQLRAQEGAAKATGQVVDKVQQARGAAQAAEAAAAKRAAEEVAKREAKLAASKAAADAAKMERQRLNRETAELIRAFSTRAPDA